MHIKKRIGFVLLLVLFLPGLFDTGHLSGQEQQKREEYREPVTDGPYIYRKQRHVQVIFIHNDKVSRKQVRLKGSRYKIKIKPFKKKYTIPAESPGVAPCSFRGVRKIFALSDIHGQYQRFKELLLKNGVINKKMRWRWGKGHLVIVGDIFDRGADVTKILWDVYRLEQQALKKGGRVHFLLGNHEMMVLQKDLRYVHPKYFKVAENLLKTTVPGLYGADTVLGQWLRSKHAVIRLNDIIFVHGGLHPWVPAKKLDFHRINEIVRANLDTPRESIKADPLLNDIFRSPGPFWYRGYFNEGKNYKKLDTAAVKRLLAELGVKHIVVGHTTQEQVISLHNKSIIGVDAGIKYGDRGEALIWKNGVFYRVSEKGEKIPLQ